jgi:beta-mannosidase
VYLSNDLREPHSGEVAWSLTDLLGSEVAAGCVPARIDALHSSRVAQLDLSTYLRNHGPRELLLWLRYGSGGQTVAENLVTFARPKHLELAEPGIATAVEDLGQGRLGVTLSARKPALWVWLAAEGLDGHWSDSFFHLRPGQPKRVTVHVPDALSAGHLRETLRTYSLIDTYR